MKFLLLFSLLAHAAGSPLSLTLQPDHAAGGQAVLLKVRAPKGGPLPTTLEAVSGETKVSLFECPKEPGARCGLVGIPAEAKKGKQTVTVSWYEDERKTQPVAVTVRPGKFTINKLRVNPELTHPSDEEQRRMAREKEEMAAIFAAPAAIPLWDGPFQRPGDGAVTSPFGNKRTFNGEVKSVHYGVDLRASKKTPILAGNAGRVVAAHEFFLAGNMVVINHGTGIFSSYAHMSAFEVKVGDNVKKGDRLGLAGATGRVTGPHLHWATRVNGVSVDPFAFKKVFNRMYGKN